MIRAMRLLNAIEAGTTTGAQLQALLTADPGRLAEFNVLLGMRGQMRRMAASSTAMTAVIASSTAMAAVAASSTAMTAVAASSTAKMAVFNSDTALNAIAASSTALTTMRAASGYAVYTGSATSPTAITSPSAPAAGGSYLVLGVSTTDAPSGKTHTLSTRRSGSTISSTTTSDGAGFASTALKYPKALPLVAPFNASDSGGYTWYFGLLRCDV